jgi:tRNA U34 5-carboxymethylaminomethyl modifying enzyme MnmG/GidA
MARRPGNIAEASMIDGMTPAAILILAAHLKKAGGGHMNTGGDKN